MALHSFEVQDIKCIDENGGDQGLIFIGSDKMVSLVLERGRNGHDTEICSLQTALWNSGRRPFTIFVQDL